MARPPLPIGAWGRISVTLESPGVYRASARYRGEDGITRTYSRRRPKKSQAEAALQQFLVEQRGHASGGELTRDSTVAELAEYWFESWSEQKTQKPETERTYVYNLKRVNKHLRGVRVGEVTTGRVEAIVQSIRRDHPETARQVRNVLKLMFDEAVRLDAIGHNPVVATRAVTVKSKEVRTLTAEEVTALRSAAKQWESMPRKRTRPWSKLHIAATIDVMLGTGIRIGEMLALRWSDLDLKADDPLLTVSGTIVSGSDGKTVRQDAAKSATSERTLYLPKFTVSSLMDYWHELERTPDTDAIFPTAVGSWLDRSNYGARFREVRKLSTEVDLSWVTPHSIRKTVATQIYRSADLRNASQQLGHSEIGVTSKHYIEHENRGPSEVVGLLDSFVGES